MKAGWVKTPLGEIAELRGRIGWKGLTAKEYTESGPRFLSVHSLNYGDYVDFRDAFHITQERYDESPEIMLKRDDILISKDGAGIGKLGVVPEVAEQTTINSSLLLIRPSPKVLAKYLYFCLLSPYFQEIVQSKLEGATTPHLYQRDIKTFPIFLPPLEEQQRIVAVLDEAFEGLARARAHAEANLQNARELFNEMKAKFFLEAPGSITETTLGTLAVFRNGLNYSRTSQGEEVKVVGVGDFKDNFEVPLNQLTKTQIDGQLGEDDHLQVDDILAVRSNGNRELIGRKMLVPETSEKISFSDFTIRIRLKSMDLLPRYLCSFMRTKKARAALTAGGGGSNISNLNQRLLSSLPISFPDVETQQTVLTQLESLRSDIGKLRAEYETKLQDVDDLRLSLLQKAFTGKLT